MRSRVRARAMVRVRIRAWVTVRFIFVRTRLNNNYLVTDTAEIAKTYCGNETETETKLRSLK